MRRRRRGAATVMGAQECRARAEALIEWSYRVTDPALVREIEAVAAEWHKLADLADQQETLRASLKGTRE
jgi:hypothetical protein